MDLWLVAFGGIFTLLGVSLGFALSEFAEARRRREDAGAAWDQLESDVRTAIVLLDYTIELKIARFVVDPPLDLPTLRAQYPLLVRAADKRVILGMIAALRYFEAGPLPVLRALWEYQRAAVDEESVPALAIEAGVQEATQGKRFIQTQYDALIYDHRLRQRLHRYWPYSRTAQDLRHALDQILEEHDPDATPPDSDG